MLNIIKMDLYKMFRSKNFYILNIALIVTVLSMALLIKFTLNMDFEKGQQSNISYNSQLNDSSTNDSSITEEDYHALQAEAKDSISVNEFMMFLYSEFLISMLVVIFLSLFVCSEWDSGFIKNLIPLKSSRISLIISKNITLSLFIIIQGMISFIASIISNLLVSGRVNIFDFKELMIYLGLQILLKLAFGSFIILISYLFRSKATSISVGILLSLKFHGLFLNVLDKVINISKFNLSELSIIGNSNIINFSPNDYKRIIIISIVYFILYNLISIIRVRKMEIN